ncbi:MAG: alkaline phosphatase family protein [Bacteroidia bacterium]|nr:MAG: alkaline phosphatase family protein [Bacteroidia bacterium]
MKLSIKIPADLKKTLLRLSLVLTILTLIRVLFLIFNWSSFPKADFFSFVIGVWFDMITLSLFMFPVIILTLVPSGKSLIQRSLEKISNIYFHLISILLYMLNLMDIEYFKYTSKRSTIDLFTVLGAGNDFKQLITTFITDFWLIFLTLFIFIIVHFKINKIITKRIANKQKSTFKNHILFTLLSIAIFIVIGRGGFQLKPVGIIEAAQYTSPNNSTLVLNTGFTMMKSYGKQGLEPIEYFKNNDEFKFFYPIKHTEAQHILPNKTNLVIIILESFGAEFIGAYNKNVSYTPFLDSLIKESLSFEYAYANGKKSIEAVPSIISSIPSLMDNPYISSPYSDNSENGLAKILKENGYSTAFFHGATNGSMRFDSYAALAGFDNYFGRKEYGNDEHFDQTWGISDEYFNPWTAKKLSTLKAPFFGTLFTISSHHPYYIPPNYKDKVKRSGHDVNLLKYFSYHFFGQSISWVKKQNWNSVHHGFLIVFGSC